MQILLKERAIKLHCALDVIVLLLHPNYTRQQINFIKPFLLKVFKTRKGLTINGFTIKGGERGWFYMTKANVTEQLCGVMKALVKFKNLEV